MDGGAEEKTPVNVSNWFVEKSQCYLKQQDDRFACKAMLLTAKTIYPQDLEIQYQAYCFEKSAQNVKQAASILLEMFRKFQQESKLLNELKSISKSLQGDSKDAQAAFQKDVYEQLPTNVQKDILSLCIDQCPNTLEKCRLRLLFLQRFNKNGHEEGVALVETLLNAEKSDGLKIVTNPYRRLMVYKILPFVLSMDKLSKHCLPKQCSKWLQKTIEFFVTIATQSSQQQKLSGGDHLTHGMLGGGEGGGGDGWDLEEGLPWESLHHMMKLVTKSSQWETYYIAPSGSGLSESLAVIQKYMQRQGVPREEGSPPLPKPAFYATLVLLLKAAYRYASLMSPQQYAGSSSHHQGLVLLEDLEPKKRSKKHKHSHKRRKMDPAKDIHGDSDGSDDGCDISPPSEATPLSAELTEAFHTAMDCWQLLNANSSSQEDFNWLLHRWKADAWTWFNRFQADRLFYLGESVQAIAMLQSRLKTEQEDTPHDNTERMKSLVQLASIYHSMTRLADVCECALQAIGVLRSNYVEGNPARGIVSECALTGGGRSGRTLHILSGTPSALLPYCIQLLLLAFKKRVLYRADSNDTGLGHLIVLMQYYWPRDEHLLNEAMRRIRKQGSFSYHSFLSFVINIDILEEFAHLKTEDGGKVNLDVLPSSSMLPRQRTVTRGVTRGGKEDFRAAMERQVMRSSDNVEGIVIRFVTEEKESIKLTFADS